MENVIVGDYLISFIFINKDNELDFVRVLIGLVFMLLNLVHNPGTKALAIFIRISELGALNGVFWRKIGMCTIFRVLGLFFNCIL